MASCIVHSETKVVRRKYRLHIAPGSTGEQLKKAVAKIPDDATFDESFTDEVDGSQVTVVFHQEANAE